MYIMNDVASAFEFLHAKGIAHHDLQPENILCLYEDQLFPVKLDKVHHSPVTTLQLFMVVGSTEFLPPEIVEPFLDET